MSGDRLAQIEELRRKGQLGAITVADVLALVKIAKAARVMADEAGGMMEGQAWLDLRAALSVLDQGGES